MDTATDPKLTDSLNHRLHDAIRYAVMAPSSHNTQPWAFRLKPGQVELFADLTRACPVVDPHNRELTISCGAALYHLRLAMNNDSLATLVRVLPANDDEDLIARVLVAGPHNPSDDERVLFDAIPKRRTNRFPFSKQAIDSDRQAEWIDDAKSERVWIHLIHSDREKHAVADLVSQGDKIQASDKQFCRELAKWVHSNSSSRRDGIPGYSQGISDLASHFGWLAVRTFDWGNGQAAKDRQLAEGSPLLAVIGSEADTPADWVDCGQALAKITLRAASCSIDASYLNQPIEVPSLRTKLAKSIGVNGYPQLLLRLGYGSEVKPTPRRSVDEVIMAP
ncbi:Acg family FMN-binding oxidoreductase [Rubripirellula reticaptiva]|uniref:Putative NAD(P)H nitroreductase n=1 Tax=Rubripirellula reticaptiva TaxID=2528013 RepID=A0A5C6EGH8_9BACT|nr:nitroreductase family protein [Rubripirellula reticaptiva]TWU46686.1 putative NAD(P)H nitroreductase [Rubripirellula reticaptiva]